MNPLDDPFDLDRFVGAQAGTYELALAELRNGRKDGHWIWFIFPQLAGLGMSAMSRRYAVTCLDEARAYLAHPLLGPRLRACFDALLTVEGEHDDISGVGQTEAAHKLCVNLPADKKMHYLQPGVGHYGVFNGSRFRAEVAPRIADFILSVERPQAARRSAHVKLVV